VLLTGPPTQPQNYASNALSGQSQFAAAQPGSSRDAEIAGALPAGQQSLGMPGQESSATGLSGVTANGTTDNVETSSKRSLTGRRRGASTGSKRSNRQVAAGDSEKQTRPGSAGRTQAGSEPRPKKRGGFLSFLGCCGSSDDTEELGSRESAQPANKPTTASQPSKLKTQQQQVAPNASATNTSADGSKEVIDEKTVQQPNHNESSAAAPILPTPPVDSEKPPPVLVQPDNPVPSIPLGITTVQPNAETSPLQAEKRDLQPETAATGPPHIDTAQRNVAHDVQPNHTANPVVSVIAPTPIASQQHDVAEDALIQDRTPEQAQRDTDIEMTDVGPSLPLSTSDVPQSSTVETTTRERSSSSSSRIDLPPPPPLAERQIHNQHSGAGVIAGVGAGAGAGVLAAGAGVAAHQAGQEPSAVSTPEPTQKWLLPPITEQFSGKKCLVLDLDETLVHSSFKVGMLVNTCIKTTSLTFTPDSPSSRLHNSCRNRRPIPQRLRH
jgi:RNA polymerase II subunit A small phosphatase-like protein